MVEEFVNIWKLLSLLFFVGLSLFLLYIFLERILTKREFKRNLDLVKDQLIFDVFKNDYLEVSDFISIDDISSIELKTRHSLKELKKNIFCDISKYSLRTLEEKVNISSIENEKKFNKLVLGRYKDAIKSLNSKIIYLKTEIDAFKLVLTDSKNTVDSIYGLLVDKELMVQQKNKIISEQKNKISELKKTCFNQAYTIKKDDNYSSVYKSV